MRQWRDAKMGDIDALVALIESAYRGDASRAGWTSEADLLGGQRIDAGMVTDTLADQNQHMIVCEEADAGLIGCVTMERRTGEHGPGYGYIGTVSVHPPLQGSGLGREILARAENWLAAHWGLDQARMTVIAWYERRGYRTTGETAPFPYGNPRFGAPKRDDLYFVLLEKKLAA
jgi:N-acetylglutamate synthase-like GNAT family acetyltransferase